MEVADFTLINANAAHVMGTGAGLHRRAILAEPRGFSFISTCIVPVKP
jgi:hypothetical protein